MAVVSNGFQKGNKLGSYNKGRVFTKRHRINISKGHNKRRVLKMIDKLRDVDMPFRVMSVLNKEENFHSGHMTKKDAEVMAEEANKLATTLGIKTRYIVKEK